MKRYLLLLCSVLIFVTSYSQSKTNYIHENVQNQKQINPVIDAASLMIINEQKSQRQLSSLQEVVTEGQVFDYNSFLASSLISSKHEMISMRLPLETGKASSDLILYRVNPYADNFRVMVSDEAKAGSINYEHGVHYNGVVSDDPNSMIALSLYPDEMYGVISTQNGNYNIGKIKNSESNDHVLYLDRNIRVANPNECQMEDDGQLYTNNETQSTSYLQVDNCVEFYLEVHEDIFIDKGSVQGAIDHVTALAVQAAIIYTNEQINTSISEIFVWNSVSPYTSTSTSTLLNQFQNYRTNWNGDLAQLLGYDGSGGIAAGFSGICNNNRAASMCYSGVYPYYSNVPIYTWSVNVYAHELGHLFGSRHTHACVWNGNNTAIDGCSGQTEGSCALPGNPAGGGTTMSYCHLTNVGINMTLGFGPQPGNVIRNNVANGNCLSTCTPPPPPGTNCQTTVSSFPYNESFENGYGDFHHVAGSELDWTINVGSTPSSGTGPTSAANGTTYMYVEASDPNFPARDANFQSPCFNLTGISNPEFTFQYHMNGTSMGTLNLEASTDGVNFTTIWTISGSQGSAWNSAIVDLSSYTSASELRLRFNGVTGSSWSSDICVDNIGLDGGSNPVDCLGVPGGPALPGTSCDDGNANTGNDIYQSDCSCAGQLIDCLGVPGGTALPGSTCDDGNANTGNDIYQSDCSCSGQLIDCEGVPGGLSLPGTSCDDGNATTINDTYQSDCSCTGQTVDCLGVPNGPAVPGTPCDDGNANTGNDTYQSDCSCLGQLIDCLGVPGGSALPGTSCDDGNAATGNDTYQSDCSCTGQLIDCLGVPGGSALPGTSCDDGNILTGNDTYQGDCSCSGIPVDCLGVPGGTALPGTSCDDGNANTINDTYQSDCSCVGTPVSGCTDVTIDFNDFESGWGIWNDGGNDCRRNRKDASYANSGTYCIRLQDNTNASVMTTDNLDLTSYDDITVDFTYITNSMDNSNEDFWLQISTNGGASYTLVEEWNLGDEFVNGVREFDAVLINGPFSSNTRLRFRCDASANNDRVYIDDVLINGCQNSASTVPNTIVSNTINTGIEVEERVASSTELSVYPNPVNSELVIDLSTIESGVEQFVIYDMNGQSFYNNSIVNTEDRAYVNVADLPNGFYLVRIMDTNGVLYWAKFIKQ